jgi:hypothetical protein
MELVKNASAPDTILKFSGRDSEDALRRILPSQMVSWTPREAFYTWSAQHEISRIVLKAADFIG